jgi:CRP-like cAMP-binding protein
MHTIMYTSFLNHIRKFVSLNKTEEEILLSRVEYKVVNNKGFILKSGSICDSTYFVAKGCFRMYVQTDNGHEQIVQFGIEDWWITDYTSFDRKSPSDFSIQALEHSAVVEIPKKHQDELFQKIPQLERYFRIILQRAYAATLLRIHYIFSFSGEERYRHFSQSFPEFIQRIPQYILASYLGFTPEFLSKIRAKKE